MGRPIFFLAFFPSLFQHLVLFKCLFQSAWNHRRSLYSAPLSRLFFSSITSFAPDSIDKLKAQYKSQQSVACRLYLGS